MFSVMQRIFQKFKSYRLEKLTESSARQGNTLNENDSYDIISLSKKGYIECSAAGQSIKAIVLLIENRVPSNLNVLVPIGLSFTSRSYHQNMVVTKTRNLHFEPLLTTRHFFSGLADQVKTTRYGQTLSQQVVEKSQSQLEQAQVATMLSVDHALPSLIEG